MFSKLPVVIGAFAAVVLQAEAAQICGTKGYDLTRTYDDSAPASAATLANCAARCRADSKCKSFVIGNKQCLLYSVAA